MIILPGNRSGRALREGMVRAQVLFAVDSSALTNIFSPSNLPGILMGVINMKTGGRREYPTVMKDVGQEGIKRS